MGRQGRSCSYACYHRYFPNPPTPSNDAGLIAIGIPGASGSREGTRIHQRLHEPSGKTSCIDTSLTRLPDGEKGERRFQVDTKRKSTHSTRRANSEVTFSPDHADTAKPTRTGTQQSGQARRASTHTTRTSVQIRQTSTQTVKTERTKRTTSRQSSINSVISLMSLRRTTSPEPMPTQPLCVPGLCAHTTFPTTDVVRITLT